MLLETHIVAGALALMLGAVALLARKGATLHRRSGQLFVSAMLVMGITASVLGNSRDDPSGTIHHPRNARSSSRVGVYRDVLLGVEGPRPPPVASARPTRLGRAHNSCEVKWPIRWGLVQESSGVTGAVTLQIRPAGSLRSCC